MRVDTTLWTHYCTHLAAVDMMSSIDETAVQYI